MVDRFDVVQLEKAGELNAVRNFIRDQSPKDKFKVFYRQSPKKEKMGNIQLNIKLLAS